MRQSLYKRIPIISQLLICAFYLSDAQALNLQQAEMLAVQADPTIENFKAYSQSYSDESVADNTLPDPKLILGAVNVPVDTFDLEQEQMTQLKLGVQQTFPRGDSLAIKQQQSQFLAQSSMAMADDAKIKILRDVRETYLNLFYEVSAYQILRDTHQLFSELVKVTESSYAAGRVSQQDVVLAGLELSRLDDRSSKIQAQEENHRSELAQWIGESAWNDISNVFPQLPALPDDVDLNKLIPEHPLILSSNAKIDASKKMTEMARQDYKPGWGLSLDYGFRSGNNPDGSERTDFATALVTLDVPLFTGNRQDKKVSANEQKIIAQRYSRDDALRQLKKFYDKNWHSWQRLGDRETLYKNSLLAAAKNNSKAALKSYQSGVAEFNTLMRAQITELDVRLEDLRIRVDRAIAHARLLYITGVNPDEK
jgi:outer membrane protein TolC